MADQEKYKITFSMILCADIAARAKAKGLTLQQLYEKTSISQSSWSRISLGQTGLGVEDLLSASSTLGADAPKLLTGVEVLCHYLVEKYDLALVEPASTKAGARELEGFLPFKKLIRLANPDKYPDEKLT